MALYNDFWFTVSDCKTMVGHPWHPLKQGCTTRMADQFSLEYLRANIDMFNPCIGCCFYKTNWVHPILGFAGQIKSFGKPHLAREPCVVHPCFKICIQYSIFPLLANILNIFFADWVCRISKKLGTFGLHTIWHTLS